MGRDAELDPEWLLYGGFNPRARVGRDKPGEAGIGSISAFQSTRPRGARHEYLNELGDLYRFNPRARVGRDCIGASYCDCDSRFNPRARVGRDCMSLIIKNFVRLQNRFRRTSPSGA